MLKEAVPSYMFFRRARQHDTSAYMLRYYIRLLPSPRRQTVALEARDFRSHCQLYSRSPTRM